MRIPRDVSGRDMVVALGRLGYSMSHQAGSHIRLTTQMGGEHHITIPAHDPIKIGTLNGILRDVGTHHGLARDELLRRLFG